jgi:hypothetical protein
MRPRIAFAPGPRRGFATANPSYGRLAVNCAFGAKQVSRKLSGDIAARCPYPNPRPTGAAAGWDGASESAQTAE